MVDSHYIVSDGNFCLVVRYNERFE